jgi:hypothetical protein
MIRSEERNKIKTIEITRRTYIKLFVNVLLILIEFIKLGRVVNNDFIEEIKPDNITIVYYTTPTILIITYVNFNSIRFNFILKFLFLFLKGDSNFY